MRIKHQVWLAALISILLFGSMISISSIYMDGVPQAATLGLGAAGIALSIFLIIGVLRNITRGMNRIMQISRDIARGTVGSSLQADQPQDEFGQLAGSFHAVAVDLQHKTAEERTLRLKAEEQAWINDQVYEMALLLQGSVQMQTAARIFIGRLAEAVGGSYGAFYLKRQDKLVLLPAMPSMRLTVFALLPFVRKASACLFRQAAGWSRMCSDIIQGVIDHLRRFSTGDTGRRMELAGTVQSGNPKRQRPLNGAVIAVGKVSIVGNIHRHNLDHRKIAVLLDRQDQLMGEFLTGPVLRRVQIGR